MHPPSQTQKPTPWAKPIPWWIHEYMVNTMSQESTLHAVVSVSYGGLCKPVDYFLDGFSLLEVS